MPQHLTPPPGDAISLEQAIAQLDETQPNLANSENIGRSAAILAGLARNPDFLADCLIAALKASFTDQLATNRYSAQVFLLHRRARCFTLRANLWPAAHDHACTSSGADAFAYGVAHDHNFSFLTIGYFGPGYVSDFYEYDADCVDGRLGEALDMRFVERSALAAGRMMLYRAHRDIHVQHPPERLSVSLNILDEREHIPWRDQYIVDVQDGTIARRPTLTSTEMLLRCAVHLSDNAHDLADQFALTHPVPRVRATAYAALAAVEQSGEARAKALERGLGDCDARVRDDCARWLTRSFPLPQAAGAGAGNGPESAESS